VLCVVCWLATCHKRQVGMKQLHHKYFVQGVKAFELTKPLSDFPADKDWEELQIVAAREVGNVGVTEHIPFIEL